MPRILFDPSLLECPDFASDTYAEARAPFVVHPTTEEQAIQLLIDLWTTGNNADKAKWQQQSVDDEAAITETRHLQSEADAVKAQAETVEAENSKKEEMKKNKSKYLPIPDCDVPTIAPVVAYNYAIRKMEKGLYVELWYYTNAGLDEALHNSNTVNDDSSMKLWLCSVSPMAPPPGSQQLPARQHLEYPMTRTFSEKISAKLLPT